MLTKRDLDLIGKLIDSKLEEKFNTKLTPVYLRLDKMDERFDKVDRKLDLVYQRVDGVEFNLDSSITGLYNHIEDRFDSLKVGI